MSLAPLPNIPYTPAPAYLWINAPPSSTPTRTVRPNLRLKISVDLLLPAIFAPKAGKRPRGLEEYFEVAVPLGGKVEVSLEVTREGTSLLRGPPPVSEEEGEEEEEEGEDTVWREGHERSCTLAETSLDNHLRLVRLVLSPLIGLSAHKQEHKCSRASRCGDLISRYRGRTSRRIDTFIYSIHPLPFNRLPYSLSLDESPHSCRKADCVSASHQSIITMEPSQGEEGQATSDLPGRETARNLGGRRG